MYLVILKTITVICMQTCKAIVSQHCKYFMIPVTILDLFELFMFNTTTGHSCLLACSKTHMAYNQLEKMPHCTLHSLKVDVTYGCSTKLWWSAEWGEKQNNRPEMTISKCHNSYIYWALGLWTYTTYNHYNTLLYSSFKCY